MTSPSQPLPPEEPSAGAQDPGAREPNPTVPEGELNFVVKSDEPADALASAEMAPPRRYGEALSLLIFFFLLTTFLVLAGYGSETATDRSDFEQTLELRLQGRYLVGVDTWLTALPGGQANRAQLKEAAHALPLTGDRAWCAALLFRELGDTAALESAKSLPPPEREGLATALSNLLAEPPVVPEPSAQQAVFETCDFLGELAWARATPDPGDEQALLSGARRFAGIFLLGMLMASLLLILGCFLAGTAFFLHRRGRLPWRYPQSFSALADQNLDSNARVPYLELTSLFFVTLFGLGAVGSLFGDGASPVPMLLNWLILPVFLWPLQRGRSWAELKMALGWHRGQGWWQEIGAGLVAYVTAAPLLLVGLTLTLLVSRWSDQQPYHPIVDWIRHTSLGGLAAVLALAVIWAPLCEESAFRGALYHYARGRFGKLIAGLGVALVFAAVHPQGLAGVPFLTSLALALALAREWRGSVVASMTMHLVHNLLVFLFMILVIR